MPREGRLPDDPIRFIQGCVRRGRLLWTYHVTMRLAGRFIPREAMLAAVETFELVEAYRRTSIFPATLSSVELAPMPSTWWSRRMWRAIMSG